MEALAKEAYTYGDAYVLESHVEYMAVKIGEQILNLTSSAHIRGGKLAPGITLQFTKGTSWIGNVFINEKLAPKLNISVDQYQKIRNTMFNLLNAFKKQKLGLAIASIDFAIGRIGGKYGEDVLLGIQDPNFSFNGAEFLREFMTKTSEQTGWPEDQFFAATWVFVPNEECTYNLLSDTLSTETADNSYSMAIAVVPGYWGDDWCGGTGL